VSTPWPEIATGLAAAAAAGAAIPPVAERITRFARRLRSRREYTDRLARLESEASAAPPAPPVRAEVAIPRDIPRGIPCFYVTHLDVQHLRCFSAATLDLRFPGERNDLALPNVNLLLGDNGAGKSTILKAIAMAALGPVLDSSGFFPFRYVREGAMRASIDCDFLFNGAEVPTIIPSHISITRRGDLEVVKATAESPQWSDLFVESSPSFFVVGYGTNRRVGDDIRSDPSLERGRQRRRYQRISSLFDDSISLVPFAAWLPQADDETKADVGDLFERLLPQGTHFTGDFAGSEPIFGSSGVDVPLRAMSDGFRSYIGWIGDLLFQMSAALPPGVRLKEMGGIALVDEVDLLLHPSWQRVVVPAISRALPNMQFIFTTHSPIVTGTQQAANIVVARQDEETGVSTLTRVDAEVFGLNAEQVLLSSYFDLETTRAPGAEPELEVLARRAVHGDLEATREYLRALTSGGIDPPREPGT
jgi:putative AbiEii toxin of type IV toxin-antitoxin system